MIKKITLIIITLISTSLFAKDITELLNRNQDYKRQDFICVPNEAKFVSFDNLINNQVVTDYKRNNIPFDLYIYNTKKEKIINELPIALNGSDTLCNEYSKKYKIEIEISKEDIIQSPEDTFYNTLNISSYDTEIIDTQDLDLIYTTQAVGIRVSQLKDFSFNYEPNSITPIYAENSFCIYTDGAGQFSLNVRDDSGAPFSLVSDINSDTIPYKVFFRTDSYPLTELFNNTPIVNIDGNTTPNCSFGDKAYLSIEVDNSELSQKQAGHYYPNNISKVIYISVILETTP